MIYCNLVGAQDEIVFDGASFALNSKGQVLMQSLAFEEELAKATNSAELIAAMTKRYPDAGMGVALQIGAKVATGEMKWG